MNGKPISEVKIVMEDMRFLKAILIPRDEKLEFLITIYSTSGRFTIFESGFEVFTGKAFIKGGLNIAISSAFETKNNVIWLNGDDVYKEFHLRGHNYRLVARAFSLKMSFKCHGILQWSM